ncbi:MAG: transmembrane 220 family protein [Bacteroidia bacterium]
MERGVHAVIGIVLAIVFTVFAILQINDSDPVSWMLVYGLLLALVVMNLLRRIPVAFGFIPLLAALAGTVLLWPDSLIGWGANLDSPMGLLLVNQTAGLILCAMTCVYLIVRSIQRRPKLYHGD